MSSSDIFNESILERDQVLEGLLNDDDFNTSRFLLNEYQINFNRKLVQGWCTNPEVFSDPLEPEEFRLEPKICGIHIPATLYVDALQELITYCYTGQASIDGGNIFPLLGQALHFGIASLLRVGVNLLLSDLNAAAPSTSLSPATTPSSTSLLNSSNAVPFLLLTSNAIQSSRHSSAVRDHEWTQLFDGLCDLLARMLDRKKIRIPAIVHPVHIARLLRSKYSQSFAKGHPLPASTTCFKHIWFWAAHCLSSDDVNSPFEAVTPSREPHPPPTFTLADASIDGMEGIPPDLDLGLAALWLIDVSSQRIQEGGEPQDVRAWQDICFFAESYVSLSLESLEDSALSTISHSSMVELLTLRTRINVERSGTNSSMLSEIEPAVERPVSQELFSTVLRWCGLWMTSESHANEESNSNLVQNSNEGMVYSSNVPLNRNDLPRNDATSEHPDSLLRTKSSVSEESQSLDCINASDAQSLGHLWLVPKVRSTSHALNVFFLFYVRDNFETLFTDDRQGGDAQLLARLLDCDDMQLLVEQDRLFVREEKSVLNAILIFSHYHPMGRYERGLFTHQALRAVRFSYLGSDVIVDTYDSNASFRHYVLNLAERGITTNDISHCQNDSEARALQRSGGSESVTTPRAAAPRESCTDDDVNDTSDSPSDVSTPHSLGTHVHSLKVDDDVRSRSCPSSPLSGRRKKEPDRVVCLSNNARVFYAKASSIKSLDIDVMRSLVRALAMASGKKLLPELSSIETAARSTSFSLAPPVTPPPTTTRFHQPSHNLSTLPSHSAMSSDGYHLDPHHRAVHSSFPRGPTPAAADRTSVSVSASASAERVAVRSAPHRLQYDCVAESLRGSFTHSHTPSHTLTHPQHPPRHANPPHHSHNTPEWHPPAAISSQSPVPESSGSNPAGGGRGVHRRTQSAGNEQRILHAIDSASSSEDEFSRSGPLPHSGVGRSLALHHAFDADNI
eukprot:Rmarinus@m.27440